MLMAKQLLVCLFHLTTLACHITTDDIATFGVEDDKAMPWREQL
jgi:hypothetical protein